ncbi:MAG: glycine cleavage system protein GcvH [Methylomonas sp.]|nr:glycine cleavage system protein GcvH [Methylomonas sp.]PPD22084.1 MAG: glycine cleavage system protein H [Methylomonas sp.]PPD26137.1 MAG: glycine cleavage system protein H [Methylomonas sp.]PPD37852.1 MAG: glycine cleavage system protein H [Methylomonas sp.]PPD42429.1 MAG: glycine cleavage system protein H [Methylomonas sp.]
MNSMPNELKYAETHEWAALKADDVVYVGITDFAQSELGDIVFIGLPDVGRRVVAKEQLAVIESVKTASDLHAPVSGTIVAVNDAVRDALENVNDDAFNAWLFAIKADDTTELAQLMDADGYTRMIEA